MGRLTIPASGDTVRAAQGIHKIKNIVIIMQENRSFDSYFGTYPGADGIPMKNGVPTVCAPDPRTVTCIKPFYDPHDLNYGGPHSAMDARQDAARGRMDGFIRQERAASDQACQVFFNPSCGRNSVNNEPPDVMGYHDARQIPNYWTYARDFVLQDHMFEANASWSLPAHLFMVSEWSARCSRTGDPMSCRNALQRPEGILMSRAPGSAPTRIDYAWTDLTYLLHKNHVSWGYYLDQGKQPDCASGAMTCQLRAQYAKVPQIWNPLPYFDTVKQDNQLGNVQPLTNFYPAAARGTLPSVSWIIPNGHDSEHPQGLVSVGQAYVTRLVNTIMQGPNWDSTAIFVAWDDWGGFYDHLAPPRVDRNGYGFRVPGLVGLHRPPGAQLRRLCQVHRGRLPGWAAARSAHRRAARPATERARERLDPGRSARGLRLWTDPAPRRAVAGAPPAKANRRAQPDGQTGVMDPGRTRSASGDRVALRWGRGGTG